MRRELTVMSTSRIDAHGDRIARDAIRDGAIQVSRFYLPVMSEHDPRITPLGRVVGAHVAELSDGELALIGEMEIFDPGEQLPEFVVGKTMRPRCANAGGTSVFKVDRSYLRGDFAADVTELSAILGAKSDEFVKKSLDPVSVLTIGGTFTVAAIATGFLNQLGVDAYQRLKAKLGDIFKRRAAGAQDCILEFLAIVEAGGQRFEVSVLVSAPTEQDIAEILDRDLQLLDRRLPALLERYPEAQRIVFAKQGRRIVTRYAIRRDAVPFVLCDDEVGSEDDLGEEI